MRYQCATTSPLYNQNAGFAYKNYGKGFDSSFCTIDYGYFFIFLLYDLVVDLLLTISLGYESFSLSN